MVELHLYLILLATLDVVIWCHQAQNDHFHCHLLHHHCQNHVNILPTGLLSFCKARSDY